MFVRVIFVSILLGASIIIQIKETRTYFGHIQTSHFLLIASIYFLTFIYILILKYSKNLSALGYLQLTTDTVLVTAIIYVTGGVESIFSFLYILTIINGSIILYKKGGLTVATCSTLLYGFLLGLQHYGWIHPFGSRWGFGTQGRSLHLLYLIVVNGGAFYLVAYLSSYLSEQTRKSRVELRARQIDINQLEVLNESIINSINSGLVALDGHNRIILFNPAAEDIFGIQGGETAGQKVETVLPSLTPFVKNEGLPSLYGADKRSAFFDLSYLKPDDQKVHLRFWVSPLRLPLGEEEGRILFFQDMTEIKAIEGEMKKVEGLALIGELAAAIAHEIRNPMASISGSIQMLKEGLTKDDVNSRLMDIVLREINRLNHLVTEFLLFARPKKLNLQSFNLNHLILESLELFQKSHHWNDKVILRTDFRQEVQMESDPEQIKQVLWNLLLNATEAMPDGGSLHVVVDLLHHTDNSGEEPDHVKIVVRDTGMGFDRKTLGQLFTPFFTTKEGGSGLGLAIVKRISEGLHGCIQGSNHDEGGAQIVMTLPRYPMPSQSH
jgi:two-component system sensor histidine kinase PilS (NtrC family)